MGKFVSKMGKLGLKMSKFESKMGKIGLKMSKFGLEMGKFESKMRKIGFSAKTKSNLRVLTLVTPLMRLVMCEQTVLTAASSFLLPNHFSTRTVFLLGIQMSRAKCLKLLTNWPRGPLTVTTLDLTETSTPSGTVTD